MIVWFNEKAAKIAHPEPSVDCRIFPLDWPWQPYRVWQDEVAARLRRAASTGLVGTGLSVRRARAFSDQSTERMMLRVLADENLNNDIISGLIHRCPEIDLVRVQDIAELFRGDDPSILEWAADRGRIVITHDISTMTRFAIDRIEAGDAMPGLFAIPAWLPVGDAIEDLALLATCSMDDEWSRQNLYLPLK